MTSQGLSNYKHKQQLKHPRRYAPIRPVQKGRFTRNTWPQSLGTPGPNPSELPGAFLRNNRAESSEYAVTLLDNIETIVTGSQAERERVLKSFTSRGITVLPDGRKIEEVVL
ncbi:MAG: hypothetical protein IT368_10495 [Candidatus Hydrogenedentes bacterium]|nr:hypothetical protein [Candidatus Hydrogenedentota bacterium]